MIDATKERLARRMQVALVFARYVVSMTAGCLRGTTVTELFVTELPNQA